MYMSGQSDLIIISDEMLERLGNYYISSYVSGNMPWIRRLTFEQWLQRVMGGEHCLNTQ